MKRYQRYKNSEVQWIGEIPVHWNIMRFRYIVSAEKGKNPTVLSFEELPGTLAYLSMDYQREKTNVVQYAYPDRNSVLVNEGDLLLLWDGSNAGEFFKSKKGILCSTCAVLRPKNISCDWFFYFSQVFQPVLKDLTNGMGIPHVNPNVLFNTFIPLPPLNEQESIANFLDIKCAEIKTLVEKQRKRIALLEELKQSIITNAITRGLNPEVTMRPSGIDWIEQIPAHWEVAPMKRYFKKPMQYGANEAAEKDDPNLPRYIRITDIDENGNLKEETFKSLEWEKANKYLLNRGDMLFARSGATVGKTFYYDSDAPACYAGYLIRATFNKNISPKFIMYLTFSRYYSNWKDSIFIQTTIQNISAEKYSYLNIFIPPIAEQEEIIKYLDKETSKIDAQIQRINREIELLEEYKQSIITEVVTGKRCVCDFAESPIVYEPSEPQYNIAAEP